MLALYSRYIITTALEWHSLSWTFSPELEGHTGETRPLIRPFCSSDKRSSLAAPRISDVDRSRCDYDFLGHAQICISSFHEPLPTGDLCYSNLPSPLFHWPRAVCRVWTLCKRLAGAAPAVYGAVSWDGSADESWWKFLRFQLKIFVKKMLFPAPILLCLLFIAPEQHPAL